MFKVLVSLTAFEAIALQVHGEIAARDQLRNAIGTRAQRKSHWEIIANGHEESATTLMRACAKLDWAIKQAEKRATAISIHVNGEQCRWPYNTITYEEVVGLSGHTGSPTMVYKSSRNGDTQRSGTMHPHSSVKNIDGLRFTVCHTGAA